MIWSKGIKRIQEVSKGFKKFQEVSKGFKRIQEVSKGFKRFQEVSRGFKRFKVSKDSKRVQKGFNQAIFESTFWNEAIFIKLLFRFLYFYTSFFE